MIRIRFPANVDIREARLPEIDAVQVTADPHVIASEAEKNGPAQRAAVDAILRPAIARLWEDGPRAFKVVSIETRAGCNYACSFCPVARDVDPRPAGSMGFTLLRKIAGNLAELGYRDRVCLFGNNEPLLDERIVDIVQLFRSTNPEADLRILTNGTRGRPDLVLQLFEAGLTTLIINNYSDGIHLLRPVRLLLESSDILAPYDVRVSVRDRTEVLTTRGGLAPNKPRPASEPRGFCALPFTDLHIAYTGDVNLCCFDAHGQTSMGNVAHESLQDIWSSPAFDGHRESLLGCVRKGLTPCQNCDFDGFRAPMFGSAPEGVRVEFEEDKEELERSSGPTR